MERGIPVPRRPRSSTDLETSTIAKSSVCTKKVVPGKVAVTFFVQIMEEQNLPARIAKTEEPLTIVVLALGLDNPDESGLKTAQRFDWPISRRVRGQIASSLSVAYQTTSETPSFPVIFARQNCTFQCIRQSWLPQ